MTIDPEGVRSLLEEAAQRYVLPRYKSLKDDDIQEKNPGDLVTIADIEAERFLTPKLSALLPGSTVVGEEAHSAHPDILSRVEGDAPVWLIDPVDGTRNFSEGRSVFCMMVALLKQGQTVQSWIYHPLSKRCAVAEHGAGAFLEGTKLRVPDPPEMSEWRGMMNTWYFPKELRDDLRGRARRTFKEVQSLSCAGMDMLAQAQGQRHFCLYRRIWPWDHAPGVLILKEAGGHVERLDGEDYRAGDRVASLMTASNYDAWHKLKDFLPNCS